MLLTALIGKWRDFNRKRYRDAVPLFDSMLKKLSMSDLLLIRDSQSRKIAADFASSFSSRRTGEDCC